MEKDDFVKHACEQVLRFSSVENWDDLSEEIKVQLGFNMGAMALGLGLSKEDGFMALADVRKGIVPMGKFRDHIKALVASYKIDVDEDKISRSF